VSSWSRTSRACRHRLHGQIFVHDEAGELRLGQVDAACAPAERADDLAGLTVSPSSFTLAPGASQTLTITADVSRLAMGQWLQGEIRLSGGSNLTVTGPSGAVPAGTPFDLNLSSNEPAMAVDDAWFALVEYGSDRQHPTNAGSLLVKLTRTG
jgi:hypothetical protein